jgi:hypothetical protein
MNPMVSGMQEVYGERTLKAAGRSLAEVQAARPSASFDAAWGTGMMGGHGLGDQPYAATPD